VFDLYDFEAIDWDDEEAEGSNLAHCLEHGVDERVVAEVLRREPREIKIPLETAEYAIVGPDDHAVYWTLLFDKSYKRGDWLRPVTGWPAKASEVRAWKKRP
jgi:hypothetical protein